RDPSPRVRETAIAALGEVGSAVGTGPLIALLAGPESNAAAQALIRIASQEPTAELRAALPIARRVSRMLHPDPKRNALFFALVSRIEEATDSLKDLPLPARPPCAGENLPRPAWERPEGP